MFLNGYPYTDFHEMNLDFLLKSMEELKKAFASFTASNSLIFAEPMLHDLTSTYAKNTIVLDPDGNAYISLQNVPAGVQLSNADYWLIVFNFEEYIEKANKNFTNNYLRDTTRAPQAYAVGDWLVLDDVLYKVIVAIAADDLLEVGVNLIHFTIEQFLKDFIQTVNNTLSNYSLTIQQYKNDIDASELLYRQQLAQDIANTTASLQAQLDTAISGATVDSEVINARVGANGVVYPTLGDAIRGQVNILTKDEQHDRDMIDGITDELMNYLTLTRAQTDVTYTTINNTVLNATTGNTTSVTGATYNISSDIAVSSDNYIEFQCSAQYTNALYVFYDSSDNVIDSMAANSGSTIRTYHIYRRVPAGAVKLRLSLANAGYCHLVYPSNKKRDAIPFNFLPLDSSGSDISFTPITNYVINGNNGMIAYSSDPTYCVTDYIDIAALRAVKVEAACGYNNGLYAFYDVRKQLISLYRTMNSGSYALETHNFIPVPSDAKYLVVGYKSNFGTPVIQSISNVTIKNFRNWSSLKWTCLGDSLTEVNARATKRYYDYISEATGINVVNLGVSASGYARGQDTNIAYYQRVSSIPVDSDVITIFGSFNDLGAGIPLGTSSDSGTTTIGGCINETLDLIYTAIPLANIGIVAPCPWGSTQPSTSGDAYNYVNLLKEICYRRSIPFLNLWICSDLRPWDASFLPYAYSRDDGNSVHPDENGHKLLAPKFEGFLDSLLIH